LLIPFTSQTWTQIRSVQWSGIVGGKHGSSHGACVGGDPFFGDSTPCSDTNPTWALKPTHTKKTSIVWGILHQYCSIGKISRGWVVLTVASFARWGGRRHDGKKH
jgi:hypothetical protein